jgi:hypothetical protein
MKTVICWHENKVAMCIPVGWKSRNIYCELSIPNLIQFIHTFWVSEDWLSETSNPQAVIPCKAHRKPHM